MLTELAPPSETAIAINFKVNNETYSGVPATGEIAAAYKDGGTGEKKSTNTKNSTIATIVSNQDIPLTSKLDEQNIIN